MTDQERKVMETALEALEWHVSRTRPIEKTTEAMDALRQALAQPEQEPVAWFDYDSSAQIWVQVYPNTHGKPLYAKESE